MARDIDSIEIEKWAASGDRIKPDSASLNPRVSRSTGWPASFSESGGDVPRREVFNQLFAEITGMLSEINQQGILEYDSRLDYQIHAHVIGTDGRLFRARRANGPGSSNAAAPPTGSTTQNTNWKLLLSDISIPSATAPTPDANTSRKGKVELATVSEATTGTDTTRAVTPAGVKAADDALDTAIKAWVNAQGFTGATAVPDASTTTKGKVELATPDEATTGTDSVRAVTPVGLQAAVDALDTAIKAWVNMQGFTGGTTTPDATTSRKGKVELATPGEATTGTDAVRAVTPVGLQAAIDALDSTLKAWVRAQNYGTGSATVPDATTSTKGKVELATVSEATTGTDTVRAVTPAGVKAADDALDTSIKTWVRAQGYGTGSDTTPDATTSRKGKVELATTSEATTGTDTVRAVTPAGLAAAIAPKAPKASPTLTGAPKATTPGGNDDSTRIATTAWVRDYVASQGGGDMTPAIAPYIEMTNEFGLGLDIIGSSAGDSAGHTQYGVNAQLEWTSQRNLVDGVTVRTRNLKVRISGGLYDTIGYSWSVDVTPNRTTSISNGSTASATVNVTPSDIRDQIKVSCTVTVGGNGGRAKSGTSTSATVEVIFIANYGFTAP